jgi:hypothetical protein
MNQGCDTHKYRPSPGVFETERVPTASPRARVEGELAARDGGTCVDSRWVAVICLPVVIGIIGVTALLRAPRDAQPEVLRALAEVVREALRPLAPSRWTKPELGTPADDPPSSPPG